MKYNCDNCNIKIIKFNIKNYDINKHHLFCNKCIKMIKVCSKSKCKKVFLLNDKDFQNLKVIYLENNNYSFYIYDDIKKIVINKYGSFNVLQDIILKKIAIKKETLKKQSNIRLERETQLKNALQLNKLEFKNCGNCYSYINYGTPDINTVISNELKKNMEKNNRRIILANKLKDLDIPLDESLKSCYEYINNLTTNNLYDIVKSIKIEHDIKYNKLYQKLTNTVCNKKISQNNNI